MLDWLVACKPKEGREEEATELSFLIQDSSNTGRIIDPMSSFAQAQKVLVDHYQDITMSGEDTLNAPTIGIDDSANKWLYSQWEKALVNPNKTQAEFMYWMRTFDEVLKHNKGKRIVEVTGYNKSTYQSPIKDKHPTSFMGNVLLDIVGMPEAIKLEAEEEHDPQEALAFAKIGRAHV